MGPQVGVGEGVRVVIGVEVGAMEIDGVGEGGGSVVVGVGGGVSDGVVVGVGDGVEVGVGVVRWQSQTSLATKAS